MLTHLKIQNFALIEKVEINFESGLNILSGETGTGKSIVIQAISLLLGGRASADWIQKGKNEAVVEGVFDLSSMPWVRKKLSIHGFDLDEDELLIKRIVNHQGKNRVFINGELATRSVLQKVCEGLVDLCSQHEHQSLMHSGVQLRLLDEYGGLTGDQKEYSEIFKNFELNKLKLKEFAGDLEDYQRRVDFLKFQVQELDQAELTSGEDMSLQEEKEFLKSAQKRTGGVIDAHNLLEGAESSPGCLSALQIAVQKLREICSLDQHLVLHLDRLEQSQALIEDVAIELNRYLKSNELDDSRLEKVCDRLALIANFRRKYGQTIEEMLEFHKKKKEELQFLENRDQIIDSLQKEILKLQKKLSHLGQSLSQKRIFAAKKLSQNVTKELKDLKMDDSRFEVRVLLKPMMESWGSKGGDDVSYLIQSNVGHDAKPIQKIASGGELSRVMLAFRRMISDRGGIGVYLFDEIDSGMGGETAFVVGRKLKSVSQKHQVICITHLAQVAAYSDHHLVVRKKRVNGMTQTYIDVLREPGKKEEIARMLGGEQITPSTLKSANELIRSAVK